MSINDQYPEWIGKLPEGWGYTDIGNIYEERKTKVDEAEYTPLSVTMSGIVPQLSSAVKAAEGSDRKLVKKGDFVINSRSDRRGACGVAPMDGSCSTINIVIHSRSNEESPFYNYVMLSEKFPEEFYRWGHGIASDLWTTRWQEMRRIQLPMPPEDVRRRIVTILDEKCSEIDNVIELEKHSIEEYRRLKQVVVEQAVTKGIRSDIQLKDTEDVGIGCIPETWDMIKIKRLFSIKKEIAGEEGHDVLSITQKGIIVKDISKNEGQMAADYSGYQLVKEGDFAMNHMDLLTGWVDISKYNGVTSPDYRVFTMKDEQENCKRYYLYVLQFCYSKQIFYSLAQGVSEFGRCRLKADKFLHYEVMHPSFDEQKQIADYLDEKITEIDEIIEAKEQVIDEMKMYRKSMIYEYVTGKKEVPQ